MAPGPKKPVLIIGFVRKEGLERTLYSLVQAGSMDIYLAIDGPKNLDQASLQTEMVKSAKRIASNSGVDLRIWQRNQNRGLAVSVITAIDWFFSEVNEGIILEDDLYFNKNFIDFASQALDHFREDHDTWLISGNNFNPKISKVATNSWSTYPLIWGWATWKSRWEVMRAELLSGESLSRMSASRRVKSFWRTAYQRATTGRTDSWAAPLAAVQRANLKFTVVPQFNLVSNIGNDESASHTSEGSAHMNLLIPNKKISHQFSFLHRKEISEETDIFLEEFIYKISWKNNFSYCAMKLFDWLKFPKKNRKKSLASILSD
ncbi:hypothetical protein A1sIA56_00200 [Candidatus Planktophila sulfonica]|uniref:Glycosyltransferase n=1 Tax=Candidatus Planktophila sulfonica TaxID=1884904 RepID=A0A249KEZ7_9ACTN|nr:hypothetical protein [Candidatus Planktophila sulfonica]ASY15371.1 hypothetical protein A1sIA56_00200 [Candidatus Planktophila sulfonica]